MFDSLPCSNSEFAMKTSCSLCDVPFGRVVHPASVYVTTTGERRCMDFRVACPGPHSRLPRQLVHLINRVDWGLRCLSHQQRQRRQQLWQTLHTQPEQLTIQGSKLRKLKWWDLGFLVSASMWWRGDGRNISFAYSVKLIANPHHVLVCLL